MSYTPRPGTVAYRVIDFLQRNEGEELSRSDIATKFECASAGVDTVLAEAMRLGLIDRRRGDDGVVWRLGQTRITLVQDAATEIVEKAKRSIDERSQFVATAVACDPTAIPVRKGVSLLSPEERRRAEFTAWFDQFDVGDSADFDVQHLPTIRAESKRHAKAFGWKFKIADTGPGRAGVERTA